MVPASVQSPTAGGGATWDTAPGDNLWHIAEETLRSTWNRDPTNTEIARYWQQLLHANHSHMSNPDDPDLIYPGQHFDLPPIAPP
jgi:nucleoid-associated protein YgaU